MISTLKGHLGRIMMALLDWRTTLRFILNMATKIDAIMITNMRHHQDKVSFTGEWNPTEGHFNGPRFWWNKFSLKAVSGRTRAMTVYADEMDNPNSEISGPAKEKARETFLKAIAWAAKRNPRVGLLAASTKHLFGKNAELLKIKYPNILWTKGDNGTFLIKQGQIRYSFEKSGIQVFYRIGINCPYGTLGRATLEFLVAQGFQNLVAIGNNKKALRKISQEFGLQIVDSYSEMGKVDAFVNCAHAGKSVPTPERIDQIRREDKKMLMLDVCQPAVFSVKDYLSMEDRLVLVTVGNGYCRKLSYVFGDTVAKAFGFPSQRTLFGCFLEAMALAYALKNNIRKEEILKTNWMETSLKNMAIIQDLFNRMGISHPIPGFCFKRRITSFDLKMRENSQLKLQP